MKNASVGSPGLQLVTQVGTIMDLSPSSHGGHEVSIQISKGRSLSTGDIICVGIPVPESTDPPIFTVHGMEHRGRQLRQVEGPGAISFTIAALPASVCLNAPVCRIFSAVRSQP